MHAVGANSRPKRSKEAKNKTPKLLLLRSLVQKQGTIHAPILQKPT